MTLIDDKKDPAQGLDIESTQDMKLSDYDFKIEAAADKETDRQAHLGVDVERTPEDIARDKKLLRKIDLHVMPLLMLTYGLQYADKITLSSAVAFDLREDTNLVGDDYNWLATGFYLAYLIAEFPFGWLMQKLRITRVLALTVLGWAVCIFGLAACNNFRQLMAIRTLLGILEAPISPGFLIIVSAWYKREEQILRSMAFFSMNSLFSLFILMLNYEIGVAARGSSVEPWRAIHLWLGSLTLVWAVILYFTLCLPKTARWLSEEERTLAHARLVSNKAGDSESGVKVKWDQVWECFKDPQVYFLVMTTILKSCASGGFSTFSTIILQSFELDTEQTISYQLPWYAIQFVGVVCVCVIIRNYPEKNLNLILAFSLLLPAVLGMFLEALLTNEHLWGRLAGFWITGFYTPCSFIIWSTAGQNIAGRTKKSVVTSITFMSWCAGFCIGPQMFFPDTAPSYLPGLYFCAACFGVCEFVVAFWYFWIRWENKRRDKQAVTRGLSIAQQNAEGCLLGLQDKTDIQNQHFRYRY